MTEKTAEFVCGACFHWAKTKTTGGAVVVGEKPRGLCFGVPPTPTGIVDGRTGMVTAQRNLRPMTLENERACAFFTPRNGAGQAANDG